MIKTEKQKIQVLTGMHPVEQEFNENQSIKNLPDSGVSVISPTKSTRN